MPLKVASNENLAGELAVKVNVLVGGDVGLGTVGDGVGGLVAGGVGESEIVGDEVGDCKEGSNCITLVFQLNEPVDGMY